MLVGRKNHGVLTGVGDDRIGRAMVQGKGVVNSISGNRVNPRVHEGKFEIVLYVASWAEFGALWGSRR
jgi:hypothetical protein